MVALAAIKRTVWKGKGRIREMTSEVAAGAQARDGGSLWGIVTTDMEKRAQI